ncbi:ABC transporter ATP-binding protein [Hyphomicrobium sp. LHD-15]|uniref:ABC transporter ATP-binding protein n=1 Tax=Hyphomicrobium sp. LHD-15 TaxID=3072142 RepID=UPI00280C4736|nr:ABC transporter ATP-binding protein [Hyphomicrobium sp. LHD-15]MDQ8699188.1 ABC transporter ATP-binding protein [Hyphomicrobium sp. LHD-15]
MTLATPLLEADSITLGYGNSGPVLADFGLALNAGEIVTILGPSGVGKSSLIRVLAGLQRPSAGRVAVAGSAIEGVHPRVAIAFQNPGLLPWLTLERNVGFGLSFKRQPRLAADDRRVRIETAIRRVGLEHARHRLPAELSGGMAQRAALARCLARQPQVLLLDEPFGALDEITRADMQRLLLTVVRDFRTATVLVTHDIDEALLLSDRIVLLGGAPARQLAQWKIELPQPRDDSVAELGRIRIDIVQALHKAVVRHH